MTDPDERDRLSQKLRNSLPKVDTDRAWERLQAEIANQEYRWEEHRMGTEGRRRRRRVEIAVAATGAVALIAAVTIGVTVGLSGDEGPLVASDSTTQSQAEPAQTTAVVAATSPTTLSGPAVIPTTLPTSTDSTTASTETTSGSVSASTLPPATVPPTTDEVGPATTSPDWAARSQAARQKALQLGEAVISYLEGSLDLGSLQDLVEDSGRAGLAEMLSLLSAPTGASVARVAGTDSGTEVQVVLSFEDAEAQQRDFTLSMVADAEAAAITSIEAGTAAP